MKYFLSLVLLALALTGAASAKSPTPNPTDISADCLHREQAGERHFAVTWLATAASPVFTATEETAPIPTELIGTLRCGARSERIIEWTWDAVSPQPTVVWYVAP